MKNFVKIFIVFALIFTTNSWSQDKNNPWQVSFGTSALNFNGTNIAGPMENIRVILDEYFILRTLELMEMFSVRLVCPIFR